jgi:hypothetical protein
MICTGSDEKKKIVKLRTGLRHLSRLWHLICVIAGHEGPHCGRFSSVGYFNQIDRTFIIGEPGPRQTPKIGQIWEICKSEPYGRHLRRSLCVGGPDWKLLIDRQTEGNINTNEQFQTKVRLQNCENYLSTKLFQISVFKIPWQWQQSSRFWQ